MSSGKIVLGILAGAAVGALAGILLAPEKGSKTRKRILRKGQDSLEDLKDEFDEFLESANDKFEKAIKETEDLIIRGKSKYEEAKKQARNVTF